MVLSFLGARFEMLAGGNGCVQFGEETHSLRPGLSPGRHDRMSQIMHRCRKITLAMLLLAGPVAAQQGFVPLFDGKNLKGWKTTSSHWTVENGLIALKDRTDNEEHNDSYLWTDRQYTDFVLDLEYKTPPLPGDANSGVFLRTTDTSDPVPTGIEIQILNTKPNAPLERNSPGAIYDLVAPSKNLHRAGQWNRYIITCKGSRITVNLNGAVVAEADLDGWTTAGKNPDGSENKFERALKDYPHTGYIGLQDHGLPVWFRKVRIRELE